MVRLPVLHALVFGGLIIQTLVLELIILRRKKTPANLMLALLIACFAIMGTQMVLLELPQALPSLLRFPAPLGLLLGPLLWLHTAWLTHRISRWKANHFLHIAPCLLAAVFIVWIGLDVQRTRAFIEGAHEFRTRWWLGLTATFSVAAYTWASAQLLRQCKMGMKGRGNQAQAATLAWLGYLVKTFGLLAAFFFIAAAGHFGQPWIFLALVAFSGVVTAITTFALRLSRLFEVTGKTVDSLKYQTSPLKELSTDQMKRKIESFLSDTHPYLDPSLSLSDLSNQLKIPSHYLSQVLNAEFQKGFYELMADYRIEEAKKRLRDPRYSQHTVLSIAYDCGFNSKSVFNEAFRKRTGQTPKQYRSLKF